MGKSLTKSRFDTIIRDNILKHSMVFDNKTIRSFLIKNNIRLKAYAECDYIMN